jgi:hypothetical protein
MERTLSQLRLYPDLSTVTIDNFLARGKINTLPTYSCKRWKITKILSENWRSMPMPWMA